MNITERFQREVDPTEIPLEWLLERYRNWREKELLATDWTQLPDAPVDANSWASYRQSLRDLPNIKNFADAELPERPV